MYKIAVMGDRDSIYGYAALGLDTFPTDDIAEAKHTLKKLASNDFAVIYMTEALAEELAEEIEEYNSSISPAIILIPGTHGNTGKGIANVKKSVEKAVGSDIIFNEKN